MKRILVTLSFVLAGVAHADAVDALRDFGREVKSGGGKWRATSDAMEYS